MQFSQYRGLLPGYIIFDYDMTQVEVFASKSGEGEAKAAAQEILRLL